MQQAIVASLVTMTVSASVLSQEVIDPNLRTEVVATGLGSQFGEYTTSFTFIDATTLLAARRSDGVVYRIDLIDGETVAPGATVLDLDIISPDPADSQSEYGVQSVTLHPDFPSNGYVYIKYDASLTEGMDTPQEDIVLGGTFSASEPTLNVIERYTWDEAGNDGSGALNFDSLIHQVTFDTRFHHGGQIAFDSDRYLYATYGELRRLSNGGWLSETAGAVLSANIAGGVIDDIGIILRLHDDGTVPADNPFVSTSRGSGSFDKWFAYGVRNSFGISIDPVTDCLWDTQNGEAAYDEINRVLPGDNLGWSQIMGPVDHPEQTGTLDNLVSLPGSTYRNPTFSWFRPIGVTGLCFLHGSALGSAYENTLVCGGINNGFLWGLQLNEARDGMTFQAAGLQDAVDDRVTGFADPVGTEAEELLFGRDFGATFKGTLAIAMSPSGLPHILTGEGHLVLVSPSLEGDSNLDGTVGLPDLLAVLSAWGGCAVPCPPTCVGDVNRDCAVDLADLLLVLSNWGQSE